MRISSPVEIAIVIASIQAWKVPSARRLPLLWGALGFSIFIALIYPDLGLNLVAESIGAIFGMFVIERVVQRLEEDRARPARIAMTREALRIYYPFVNTLNSIARHYVTAEERDLVERAIADGRPSDIAPILARFSSTDPIELHGTRSWGRGMADTFGRVQANIDRFIGRYAAVDEPELIAAIQDLEDTRFLEWAGKSGDLDLSGRKFDVPEWEDVGCKVRRLADAIEKAPGGKPTLNGFQFPGPLILRGVDASRRAILGSDPIAVRLPRP